MDSNLIVGLVILVIFIAAAVVMFTRTLPALLVLPVMALGIVGSTALITGEISLNDINGGVIAAGAFRLHEAIIVAMFGGIISFMMQKSGVAESLVKNAAELIGDNPLGVSLFALGLVALLFTSIGGLGAIIMVAMVVLPMLATVGVPPVAAGGIMLFGISVGGILNAGTWVLYANIVNIPVDEVKRFALMVFFLSAMAGSVFVVVELFRAGAIRSLQRVLLFMGGVALVAAGIIGFVISQVEVPEDPPGPVAAEAVEGAAGEPEMDAGVEEIEGEAAGTGAIAAAGDEPAPTSRWWMFGMSWWLFAIRGVIGLFFLFVLALATADHLSKVKRWRQQIVEVKWYAYLIPILPLVLIIGFNVPILAAFFFGVLYAMYTTLRPGTVNMTVQCMIQGSSAVLPAALLMLGIGILLNSILGPAGWSEANGGRPWPVNAAIEPLINNIVPGNRLMYVIVFSLLAPMALYRGPLNMWGLGSGVAAILILGDAMTGAAVMAMILTVGMIQGICDPTNTHNVWLANELRVDVQTLMWRTLPYVWGMVIVGLIISAFINF